MQPKRGSSGSKSQAKVFTCTGHGNCCMQFTRSEHLARHERKHTGEKPFQCEVDGCQRMFSRYDNMKQHTLTHKKPRRNSIMTNKRPAPLTNSHPEPSIRPSPFISCRTLPPPRRSSIPYPTQTFFENAPRNRFSWPSSQDRRGSASSSDSPLHSPGLPPTIPRRRISVHDLCLPIQEIQNISLEESPKASIDLSFDEFEALEGIGRFNSGAYQNFRTSDEALPSIIRTESPHLLSQVYGMRQRVATSNVSYQRG